MSDTNEQEKSNGIEQSLFLETGFFKAISENSQFGIIVFDDKNLLYTNSYFSNLLEYSQNEILQVPIHHIIHEDYYEIEARTLTDLFSGKEISPHYELKVYTKSKKIIWLDVFASSYRLQDDKIVGYATTFDITRRQNAFHQEKLLMSRWENTFNSVNDLIFILNHEYTITMANKAFKAFFRDSQEPVIGKKCYELVGQSDRKCVPCIAVEAIKDQNIHTQEWTDQKTNRTFLITVLPILDDIDKTTSFINIARDITNLKKIECDLMDSLNVQSKMISVVSHELRTPLAAIKGGIDLLKITLTKSLDADQKNLLDIILRNIDRLHIYINDVLDYEKLRSGQVKLKLTKNDMNAILKEAYDLMTPLASEKGISIRLDLDPELPLLHFDKNKVIQVIANLLNNAIKFTSEGGITIYSRFNTNYIEITIEDTGVGIKENELPFIFQSFVQLYEPDQQNKGSGLGLSISKEIIEKHGGKIWAESVFGKGSSFHFTLPVNQEP